MKDVCIFLENGDAGQVLRLLGVLAENLNEQVQAAENPIVRSVLVGELERVRELRGAIEKQL